MTDTGQTDLAGFAGDGADDEAERDVEAEARAVAGPGQDASRVVDPEREAVPDAQGTVEVAVTQVDYTVVGSGRDERPIVHVFGRTPDGDQEHVKVLGFRPYFYAPTDSLSDEQLDHDRITGWEETDDDGEPYESIRGERLTRIYAQTPRDVGQMRDEFEHFEADILFPNRLLIDKDVRGGVRVPERRDDDGALVVPHDEVESADVVADPRVLTLDIEVDDRRGFPEEGEEPILCLTTHDSYDDEYVLWLYEAPEWEGDRIDIGEYEPIRGDIETEVRRFEDETAMLDALTTYVQRKDQDVLTGWNCLPGDSEVQMADGRTKQIADVRVGDTVVGSDDQTSTVAEVTNKWRSEKEVLEFELGDGTSLRSSEEHRIMVGDDESVEWTEAAEVAPGDYVLKPRTLSVEDPSVPHLSEFVPRENQRFADESTVGEFKNGLPYGAVSELANEFGLSKGTMYHPSPDVWTPERCERASETYDVPVPDGGRVYQRNGIDLDRPLTGQEAYLAGLVVTDGSMSRDDGIRFYNTREELHEQFPGENRLEPDGNGCYKQTVLDFARMHVFNGLGIPFGDKDDTEVDLSPVYRMPEEYIARFLAGAIDGDGSVSSSVTIATENESLGDWYVRLFKRLGVYAERNGNLVRVPDAERDIETLKRRVLPHMSHSEKAADLRSLSGGKSGRTENIPYALFEADTGSEAKRIGRDKHRRGISLKRHETDVEEWTDYVFVEVDSVETVGTETTYDIETTTHNFVAEDCLVHNCDDFDIPYLLDRMEEIGPTSSHDLDVERLSRVDEVWRSGWGGPDVKGRVVFDLLYAYKRTQFTELESYRLDAVGEMELGVGKERYPGDIGDLWEDDPQQLLEYNLRDVELCVEIDREQDVIPFWMEVASFVGCLLEDAPTPGDAVDVYVLHEAHGEFALPSKGQQESEEFEGGAVFEPISGVRENVSVLDLKSLYPMSMVSINASPETRVGEEFDGETYRAPNGQLFRKEPDGMIRTMVDELLEEREAKKDARNDHDPGSEAYERFDRQQGAVKVIMNCFTPDTDVLTPEGVRNIRDLDVGDEVYSLDPDTMEMEVKPVEETHEYPDYRGELVDIETSKIDLRVTPNHRMLVRKAETNGIAWDEDDYRFVEAGELDRATNYQLPHDWDGPGGERIDEVDVTELLVDGYEVFVDNEDHGHTLAAEVGHYPKKVQKADIGTTGYVFPPEAFERHRDYLESASRRTYVHSEPNRKWVPRTYDGDDFLELLAWYVTEGSVSTSEAREFDDTLRGSATTVSIAQDAPAMTDGGRSDHAAIGDLLDRMGFDYYVDESGYQFTSRLLGGLLEDLCGAGSDGKRIPEMVFRASRDQKRAFLETLIAGDGDRQVDSWRYSTGSKRLRDDVLRLCTHLGLTASYSEDSGVYRIYVTEGAKNTLRMHRSAERSEAEDGVYCVTVADNHTLLAGRNGTFQFVGQSLYGVLGWDRFRLYDKDMGAAVTATGRAVIEFTEKVSNEMDYQVTYGDSVTGDRPVVVRDPDGRVRIIPVADLYDRVTDGPDSDLLITADGGPVAEATVGKERSKPEGWTALSMSEEGKPEWQPIEEIVRHEPDKPVVNLQHKFGESTTTTDHSFVVEGDDGFTEASPEAVEEPLRIQGVPTVDTVESVDLYEVLDGYTRTYEDGRSVGAENAQTEVKRVHTDGDRVWFGHEHHRDLDKTVTLERHVDLDSKAGKSLVRLLAAYVAEGSASTEETTDARFGASIASSDREWLERLQEDYHRLFGDTTASIVVSDTREQRNLTYGDGEETTYEDRTEKLQMMNELAAVFFREFAGQTSRGKRIPSFVFHLPDDLQRLFVETLVEGDGSRKFRRYTEEYCERNFDYETASRELAAGLSILLTQRDRKHSLKYRDEKGTYTIRTCDYYRSGQDPVVREVDHDGYVYDLSVAENDNFVDAVGGIVLHNTDSVMLELGADVSTEEAIDRSFAIEERINERYDEFAREQLNAATHRFQIEFEKLYRRFFQAGKKKRYAGHIVWKEGKDVDDIDITGFEYKRSDIAPITKEVQREVIEKIVRGEDRQAIKTYVSEVVEDFQAGNVDLDDVGIPGGIGKRLDAYETDTAQVRGAKYANLFLGTNFGRGSKPKRLYLEKNGIHPDFFTDLDEAVRASPLYDQFRQEVSEGDGVICFEYADQVPAEFQIDWEKMLEKTLQGPIARVIEALGVSWDEVVSGHDQSGLGEFM